MKNSTERHTHDNILRRPPAESPGNSLRHLDVHTSPTADAQTTPSKSQRKREAHALQALGARLVELSSAQLVQLELPDVLREAVLAVQGMRSHGARTRQMQYIGRLMRQLDAAVLRTVREALASMHTIMLRPQP
jgi:ribosome-associated protein